MDGFAAGPSADGLSNRGQPPQHGPGAAGGMGAGQALPGMPPFDNPMAKIGIEYGSQILEGGSTYFQNTFGQYVGMAQMRYYFQVNNSYVLNKLRILLCPFLHKSWGRRAAESMVERPGTPGPGGFLPPRDDINAPDMYIPVMAFVTYILIVGLAYGLEGTFHPEKLGIIASKATVFVVLEVLFTKLGFYLLDSRNDVPMLDLVAFVGYKFPGIIVNVLLGVLLGGTVYYLALLYNAACMGFFLVRSLRLVLQPRAAGPSARNRNYFLVTIAIMQLPLAWLLGIGSAELYRDVPAAAAAAAAGASVASAGSAATAAAHDAATAVQEAVATATAEAAEAGGAAAE